jgi:hypothetical protein
VVGLKGRDFDTAPMEAMRMFVMFLRSREYVRCGMAALQSLIDRPKS